MERFESDHNALSERVQTLYVVHDVDKVTAFVKAHRRIPLLLSQAEPYLRKFFGQSIIQLHLSSDENGWEMLYVTILWSGDPEAALVGLDRFDDAWWIANSYPAGTYLTFTYRLV
jgi:hypothetical protein